MDTNMDAKCAFSSSILLAQSLYRKRSSCGVSRNTKFQFMEEKSFMAERNPLDYNGTRNGPKFQHRLQQRRVLWSMQFSMTGGGLIQYVFFAVFYYPRTGKKSSGLWQFTDAFNSPAPTGHRGLDQEPVASHCHHAHAQMEI